jgi:glutamine amidotransferase
VQVVTVVDLGVGNLGAIPNMLRRLGASAVITSSADDIAAASKLVLPGVGAFDPASARLDELGLRDALTQQVQDREVPVLGLCLGMQLLAESSEEGVRPGLGWIPGKVVRFRLDGSDASLRVPEMGWNHVRAVRPHPLLEGLGDRPRFYFAHSYHIECTRQEDVAAVTTYGYQFASVVTRAHVMGAQFHPEKSHRFGMKIFENFLGL